MSQPEQIADMVRACEAELGSCDILVNNAGIQHVALVEDFPVERWDAIIAINLSSAFHTMRAALPGMKARAAGAASSTWPRCTAWWPRRRRAPTWPPSTGSSA